MDEHFRPRVMEVIGGGGLTAVSLALTLAGVIAAVVLWEEAGVIGRVALVTADAACALFAIIAGTYQYYDLAELRDRHRYNRERRMLLLERLETALNVDLNSDGVIGRSELPRPILVRGAVRRPTEDDDDGQGTDDPILERLLDLVDKAGTCGLSVRKLLPALNYDREFYDYALGSEDAARGPGVLVALGLVEGRCKGAEGRLVYDPETTKRILRRAWRAATAGADMSNSGNGRH